MPARSLVSHKARRRGLVKGNTPQSYRFPWRGSSSVNFEPRRRAEEEALDASTLAWAPRSSPARPQRISSRSAGFAKSEPGRTLSRSSLSGVAAAFDQLLRSDRQEVAWRGAGGGADVREPLVCRCYDEQGPPVRPFPSSRTRECQAQIAI